jgi:hypothetical protein
MSVAMTKRRRLQIRVILIILFVVLLPLKYAILSVGGTETLGKVVSLSTQCDGGKPGGPQPRITASYLIDGTEQTVLGGGGYGNPDFCEIRIGSAVKLAYFKTSVVDFVLTTIGDPKEKFLSFLLGGILINIVGNLMLALLTWDETRTDAQNRRAPR